MSVPCDICDSLGLLWSTDHEGREVWWPCQECNAGAYDRWAGRQYRSDFIVPTSDEPRAVTQ